LIFTLNKELSLQVYKEIRLLDTENKLNVFRVGPISHFAPVVELLVLIFIFLERTKNKKLLMIRMR